MNKTEDPDNHERMKRLFLDKGIPAIIGGIFGIVYTTSVLNLQNTNLGLRLALVSIPMIIGGYIITEEL